MLVLFLDIDYVLNNAKFFDGTKDDVNHDNYTIEEVVIKQLDPKNVKNLGKILSDTDCKVVLSSSWRKFVKLEQLTKGLNENGMDKKCNNSFISKTPVLGNKSKEIQEWLDTWNGEKINSFVILDDSTNKVDNLKSFKDNWIKTKPKKGLTPKKAEKAINKLKNINQTVGSIQLNADASVSTEIQKPEETVPVIS